MLNINFGEFLVIGVVILLVVGPERLPEYAAQLGRLVRELRRMALGAREQVRAEMGPEFDDIDWAKLDPRQYDPRRIVRDALTDTWDEDEMRKAVSLSAGDDAEVKPASRPGGRPGGGARRPGDVEGPAPYDGEAT